MSFNLTSKIVGMKNLEKILSKYPETVRKEAAIVVAEGALMIHAEAVKSIAKQGSNGGDQVRYNPTRTVKVSKPGSPPNADTGRLMQSIEFDVDMNNAKAFVGTNLKYGAYLEFGARSINLEARPWLAPAYAKFKDKIIKNLEKVLKYK